MMDIRTFAAWLRPVVGFLAFVGMLVLSGCGGGGGSPAANLNVPPPATGPGQNVLVVQPALASIDGNGHSAAIEIYSGIRSALTVSGGTPPYKAFSSNPTVLPVASSFGGNSLTLLAAPVIATGQITVTIQDSVGSTVLALVTVHPAPAVEPPPELIVVPPNLDAFPGIPTSLTVAGGVPPYRAFSSNSAILPVTQAVSGTTVPLLAGVVAVNTTVTITVLDSLGQAATSTVIVHPGSPTPPPALIVLPTTLDAFSGIATQLTVSGGVPPYRAFSTNPTVLPVTQNVAGNTIPLVPGNVTTNTTVIVTVLDAVSQTQNVTVTVHPTPVVPPPALSALPTTLDAFAGVPTQITIIGGVAPYRAFTTNSAVLPVTQNVVGNTVPLLANAVSANTTVIVTILDSAGQAATVTVTVRPGTPTPPPPLVVLPTSIDIYSGIASQLTVSGGVPPYRAFSNNQTVLPVAETVVDNVVPLLATTVTANTNVGVTVQDAAGQTVVVAVVVHPRPVVPPPPLSALPSPLEIYSGTASQITIVGGVEPYRAFSTNPTILPVSVVGNAVPLLAATVTANTNVTVTILDAAGQVATVAVTVHPSLSPAPPSLAVFPAVLDAYSGVATQITINGGVAPYRTFSTNPLILPVTTDVVGNTVPLLPATVTANTAVTVTVLDAVGQTASVNVTVHPPIPPPPALVVLPASQDVFSGIASQLTISGGVPPYRAFSTNTAILPVTQNVVGSTVPLLANTVTALTAVTVTVQDSVGQTVNVVVTVRPAPVTPPPPLAVLPTSLDAYSGVASQLTVSGGLAPYRAFSTNPAVLPVVQDVVGNAVPLMPAAVTVNTNVTIAIQDAAGQVVNATVTVHPGPVTPPPALVVLPATQEIYSGIASMLTISGGVPPYRAFSTNSNVLPITQNVVGSTVPLLANPVTAITPVTVTVQDSFGQTVTSVITVRPAPNTPPAGLSALPATLDAYSGIPTQITVIGGVPPYRAFTTNASILPVTQDVVGSTVPLVAATVTANTTVTVTILDSFGQSATVAVTVRPGPPTPPPALVVLPTTVDIYSGITAQLAVTGGVPPYRAFSTNSAVLPVAQSVVGNSIPLLAATVTANTTVTITVQDSVSQTVSVVAVVHPAPSAPPPPLVVLPAATDVYSGIPTQLTIIGGAPPYRAFSTNSTVLPVGQTVAGNSVPLLATDVSAVTPVIVTVLDSFGQTVVVNVTVRPRVQTPAQPLSVLPSDLVVISGTGSRVTVSGGLAPYRAFSSNPSVLPVDMNVQSNTVLLNANSVTANTAVVITIQDSVGQTVNATVSVRPSATATPPPLSVLPNNVTIVRGVPVTLTITGGASPYFSYSSNPGVLPVSLNVTGNSVVLNANAVTVDTDVAVTVQDSAGQTAVATVHVRADGVTPPPALTVLPGTSIVFSGVPSTLLISGGTPPYLAFTSNGAVLPVTQSVAGNVIPLFGASLSADTTVTITVQDSQSRTATASVTVRPAPLLNALTITPNRSECGANAICSGQDGTAAVTVTVPGGGPAPGRQVRFDVLSGPYGITQTATSTVTQSQTVTSDAAGRAQVIIKANVEAPTQFAQLRATDLGSGQQLTGAFVIVQITDGSKILTVIPHSATIIGPFVGVCSFGFRVDYYIYGGTPPYRITSAIPDAIIILTPIVNEDGGFFEVATNGICTQTDLAPTNDIISIVDATGRVITANINNLPGSQPIPTPPVIVVPELDVVPGNVTATTCTGAIFPFIITGGTPPYNVIATPRIGNNPTITPPVVQVNGGQVDIGNVTGTIVVSFIDSTQPKKTFTLTITCGGGGGGGGPLMVTPPIVPVALTCVGRQSTFTITGGSPPYTVRPANSMLATVNPTTVPTSGGQFIATTLQNSNTGGSTQVFITTTDSVGAASFALITCP